MANDDEARRITAEHRRVWLRKSVLRRIYRDEFFARLLACCRKDGVSVEVGAGPGFFAEMLPGLISTDVVWSPWLSCVADARRLPFRSASVTNLVGLDVLHHVDEPMRFLADAERVLAAAGRLVLLEPWITPFSFFVWRYLHQERCDLEVRPLEMRRSAPGSEKRAFDGNSALPYLLFGPGNVARSLASLPRLQLVRVEPFCLFAYLLSLGFKRFSLLPERLYSAVARLERSTLPLWRDVAALRALIVLERSG